MKQQPVYGACLVVALALFSCQSAPPAEFYGELNPGLAISETPAYIERLESASEASWKGLPISAGNRVFKGSWKLTSDAELAVFLIEPVAGDRYLYADANLDGVITPDERYEFLPFADDRRPSVDGEVRFDLPLKYGPYEEYPMWVRRYRTDEENTNTLLRSALPVLEGSVDIAGLPTKVQYWTLDPKTGQASIREGWMGIDSDQDGEINSKPDSPEFAFAEGETLVFRVGEYYVSTKDLSLETGRIVLQTHDPSDYQRIEMVVGTQVPDFAFTDFEGRSRTLSDFRGKALLLDFWGTWCRPCVAQIPDLKEIYGEFHDEGVEFLGMNWDPPSGSPSEEDLAEGLAKAKGLVQEEDLPWPQATTRSILEVITKRFRVTQWPTLILLDTEGTIVSLPAGKDDLRVALEEAVR